MDFRWVIGLTLWTLLSGPVLVRPKAAYSSRPAEPVRAAAVHVTR
jgi:hypothetical protein